jgi:hypothetical protein
MKKYLLVASAGLLLTAGVTATVLNTGKKKTTKNTSKCCMYKEHCMKASKTACY